MSLRFLHYVRVTPLLVGIFWSVEVTTLYSVLLLGVGVLLYRIHIRCPECGKRIDYNPTRIFLDQWAYTICVPKKCSRCRHPLSSFLDAWIL